MPTKDLAPFSYISPQKNPLFNDKVWTYYRLLVSKRVKSQKTEKIRPTHKPRYRASAKISFIIAIQPFHWCRQNAHKNITITVSVKVSVTVRVSLVLFVSTNTFGASSVAICWRCVYKILVAFAQRCVYNKSVAFYTRLCIGDFRNGTRQIGVVLCFISDWNLHANVNANIHYDGRSFP